MLVSLLKLDDSLGSSQKSVSIESWPDWEARHQLSEGPFPRDRPSMMTCHSESEWIAQCLLNVLRQITIRLDHLFSAPISNWSQIPVIVKICRKSLRQKCGAALCFFLSFHMTNHPSSFSSSQWIKPLLSWLSRHTYTRWRPSGLTWL